MSSQAQICDVAKEVLTIFDYMNPGFKNKISKTVLDSLQNLAIHSKKM